MRRNVLLCGMVHTWHLSLCPGSLYLSIPSFVPSFSCIPPRLSFFLLSCYAICLLLPSTSPCLCPEIPFAPAVFPILPASPTASSLFSSLIDPPAHLLSSPPSPARLLPGVLATLSMLLLFFLLDSGFESEIKCVGKTQHVSLLFFKPHPILLFWHVCRWDCVPGRDDHCL